MWSNDTNTIVIDLVDGTGLANSTISVVAFSSTSKKTLSVPAGSTTATFTAIDSESGTLPTFVLGTEITAIEVGLDPLDSVDGARIYFFVAATTDSAPPMPPPTITYSAYGAAVVNVDNPPNADVAPYTFAEFTVVDLDHGPVIDLQTVDGFTMSANLALDGGDAIGQPTTLDRQSVVDAFAPFMNQLGDAGAPYLDLQYSENQGGLLNPGIYLTAIDSTGQIVHLDSSLNTAFDDDLGTLFSSSDLSLQGVASPGTTPTIATDVYTSTPGTAATPSGLQHPTLTFTGTAVPSNVFDVFDPRGICVLSTGTDPIEPIAGQLESSTAVVTFTDPLPAGTPIEVGMYVMGAGVDPNSTQVTEITLDDQKRITAVGTSLPTQPVPNPAASQYGFSKLPGLFMTSGAMVLANAGVFAYAGDLDSDAATVAENLQNQLVSALNRGVALIAPTTGDPGYTSGYWATQTNWYPAGSTQNLFSLFMHTATAATGSSTTPIFLQPSGAVTCARGDTMGQAYGFAYDENAGPVPPGPTGQPDVPSKYDPLPDGTTTVTITLGPWTAPA